MLSNETDAAPDADRRRYRPEIDGMRCLAVSLVVAYHLLPDAVPNGFVGVDCFFVVSGFVVTTSLLAREATGFGRDLLAFYARRVQRLLPALVACIAVTAIAFALVAPPVTGTTDGFRTGAMALAGLSNWQLIAWGTDYFGPDAALDPFAHTWSLAIEEQFYLCFAPLLLLARGTAAGRWIGLAALVAASAASLAWFVASDGTVAGYFATTGRAWEMLLGVVVALVPPVLTRKTRAIWPVLAALGLLGTAVAAFAPLQPATASTGAALAAAALLLGSSHASDALLSSAPMRWIGLRSYGIYLWHWPLIVLLDRAVGQSGPVAALAAVATVAVAAASYRWLETPVRSLPIAGAHQAARRVIAGIAALAAAALVTAASAWWLNPRWSMAAFAARDLERDPAGFAGLDTPDSPRMELVLLGDSHAQMLWPAIRTCAEQAGIGVRNATGTGMLVSEELALDRSDRDYGARRQFVRRTVDEACAPGALPRVLLVACRFTGYLEREQLDRGAKPTDTLLAGDGRVPTGSDEAFARFERSLAETVARAGAAGLPVVLMAPIPELRHPPSVGLLRRGRGTEQPTRAEEDSHRGRTLQAMRRVAAAHANVSVWDPIDLLCPGESMDPWRDGALLYRDTNHLSVTGARLVAPALCEAIQRAAGLSN